MLKEIKNKKILFELVITLTFILAISITYAFFEIVVKGNEDTKTINVKTGNLSLYYSAGPEVIAKGIFPGDKIIKTFTVTNTGDYDADFDILMSEMINTIEREELQYSLECHSYKNYNIDTVEDLGVCEGINDKTLGNESYQN